MIMVTRPAEGIPAAPMAAAVAVILERKRLLTKDSDGQHVISVRQIQRGQTVLTIETPNYIKSWTEQNGTGNRHSQEVKYSAARTPKRAIFPTLIWGRAGRGLNFHLFSPRL